MPNYVQHKTLSLTKALLRASGPLVWWTAESVRKPSPPGDFPAMIRCTGRGNSQHGCRKMVRVRWSNLFFTTTVSEDGIFAPRVTFECGGCKSWTDVDRSTHDVSRLKPEASSYLKGDSPFRGVFG